MLNDLGLALMDSGNLEAALEAYNQARALDPRFAPVEFNRALALERLGLPRAGLEAMREASQAALGGWKDEAARTVAALEQTAQARNAESDRVEQARGALLDGTLPDPQLVRAYPGTFRFQLYTALAFAADRAAVEKLLPLARQLDGSADRRGSHSGSTTPRPTPTLAGPRSRPGSGASLRARPRTSGPRCSPRRAQRDSRTTRSTCFRGSFPHATTSSPAW